MECAACHVGMEQSASGLTNLLPGHPQCAECHDVQATTNCTMCHTSADPKPVAPITEYSIRFSHCDHLVRGKLECATCHQNLDQPLEVDRVGHFPNMAECMTCHDQRQVKNECLTCHTSEERLIPKDHVVTWLQQHGAVASFEEESRCLTCHGQPKSPAKDCQSCHNGDQIFFPHPRNYIARHGQDAHLSDLRCMTCHETQSDCNSCHRQMNVLPADHFRPGWVSGNEGGEHGTQAQFDLESCMSCHDSPKQEPVCARCHGK